MKTVEIYHHRSKRKLLPLADLRQGNYYVTVRDGPCSQILLGPFAKHLDALKLVEDATAKAIELDPAAHFFAFGTARLPPDFRKPGILNKYFRAVFPLKPLPLKK